VILLIFFFQDFFTEAEIIALTGAEAADRLEVSKLVQIGDGFEREFRLRGTSHGMVWFEIKMDAWIKIYDDSPDGCEFVPPLMNVEILDLNKDGLLDVVFYGVSKCGYEPDHTYRSEMIILLFSRATGEFEIVYKTQSMKIFPDP
jgi:hypothetical protein